jgi:hypothetical protein
MFIALSLGGILWAVHLALSIIAISDVLKRYRDLGTQFVLILMILLLPLVGPGLYLVVLRPRDAV